MAEVEKIWILYDVDCNGALMMNELVEYLNETVIPYMTMSEKEVNKLF